MLWCLLCDPVQYCRVPTIMMMYTVEEDYMHTTIPLATKDT